MSERRDALSTADLADQQPADPLPPAERVDEARGRPDVVPDGGERRDVSTNDRPLEVGGPDREGRLSSDRDPLGTGAHHTATAAPDASSTTGLLASEDAEGFRARWTDVQTGFVDEPRRSVEQADALVAELMQHLAETFADERAGLERQWDRGDDIVTDDLRAAFQRYRSFFERLLAT